MPRVFLFEMLDEEPADDKFDDEDYDPYLAAPEAFQYLPAPELGGPQGPVRVAVRDAQVGAIDNGPSTIDLMLGRAPRAPDPWEAKAETAAARIATALSEIGAVRAYIRYDGGNDEGFAWFDHCAFKDGSKRDANGVAKDLEAAGVEPGIEAFDGRRWPVRSVLDDVVASMWAVRLLGEGYGTGEYVMYGAFSVDLESGLVSDDPDPAPVVQNISLKAQ